jgi:hypothetical protein
MAASAVPCPAPAPRAELHARFQALLPRVERHARVFFRHLRCPDRKQDAIHETIALAWQWFVRLAEQGKDASQFPSALADFAARRVNGGRRLCGKEKANDVLSPAAQQRRGFTVSPLPDGSSLLGNVFDEALADNTVTPIPDQVIFRLDWPAWLRTRTARDRRLIGAMALSERTQALARTFGISPGRVSQLRRAFHADWELFCADPVASEPQIRA